MEEIDIKDNLFEHFSFSVDPGQDPLRIDKFLMNRIENRAKESKNARSDDNEEVLKNRLNIYHESTEMIKPYYLEQKKLIKIDGMRSIEQVSSDIEGQLINIKK